MIEYTVRVYRNGPKQWWLNGNLHREDGPAVEYADGTKMWYLYGERHREDGPAVEYYDKGKYASGALWWYLNGIRMTEEEHKEAMNSVEEMTMEEICKALGKTVKVIK